MVHAIMYEAQGCPECGLRRPQSGHYPCLENLPGVAEACCGHGDGEAYIAFDDGRVIRFTLLQIETPRPNPRGQARPLYEEFFKPPDQEGY